MSLQVNDDKDIGGFCRLHEDLHGGLLLLKKVSDKPTFGKVFQHHRWQGHLGMWKGFDASQ